MLACDFLTVETAFIGAGRALERLERRKYRLVRRTTLVSGRAEVDVLTKRGPEQQLKHLRKVEAFRRLASDAKIPERPVSLEQPKLVSNVLDLET